jgi:phage terminase large subunit-like protein
MPHLAKYENKPEVVCIAVDRGQAEIVWGDARDMAIGSPEIAKRLNVQKTKISHKSRGGELRKLSKDTKNKDGGAPCIIVVDEYHDHPTSAVKDKTAYGKGKRTQSLEIIITTAGEDAENKPCKIEDDTVKKILRKEIKADSYFGMIRQIDDGDDPHDQKNWVKANPIFQEMTEYSKSIYAEMKNEHDLAFGSGDTSKIRQWMIKRVNRWQVDSENKYFSGCMDKWKNLAESRSEFLEITKGKECYNGLDLGKCVDLTANGFVFRLDDGRIAVSAHGFIPENTATKHEHGDRVPYKSWAKAGWCTLTEGDVTDDRYIKQHLHDMELDNEWKIKEICYDPYGARQYANVMTDDGYTCVEIRQGVQTLSEPTKKFRELVLQGKVVHDGSPLLTWCLSNAVEVTDNNGNIKLSKKHKDDSQRIDLIAAIMNALTRALVPAPELAYKNRGLRSLK